MRITIVFQIVILLAGALHGQCVVGTNQPPPFISDDGVTPVAWAKGTPVTWGVVCGAPSCIPINQDLQNGIASAFTNWSGAAGANNSGVGFNLGSAGDTNATYSWISVSMAPDSSVSPNVSVVQIVWTRTPPYTIAYATVAVSDTVTVRHYMNFVIAHEIGHTMALKNCPVCGVNTTVMLSSLSAPPLNSPAEGLGSPSDCDNQQVRQTAYP